MRIINYYIAWAAFIVLAASCKKESFQLYESGNYVQFVKHVNDSTTVSFLSIPNEDRQLFPIVVELVGKPMNVDRSFNIQVIDALTTAKGGNYEMSGDFVLRANRVTDTAWITIKKTPAISIKSARLVFKLLPGEDLLVGQSEYSAGIVNISNMISKPNWWNANITYTYLGEYSDKKYRVFIQVTGKSDIDPNDTAMLRLYTFMFKNYLQKEKDAGRTVYEENGTEMIGGAIGG